MFSSRCLIFKSVYTLHISVSHIFALLSVCLKVHTEKERSTALLRPLIKMKINLFLHIIININYLVHFFSTVMRCSLEPVEKNWTVFNTTIKAIFLSHELAHLWLIDWHSHAVLICFVLCCFFFLLNFSAWFYVCRSRIFIILIFFFFFFKA